MKSYQKFFVILTTLTILIFALHRQSISQNIPVQKWNKFVKALNEVKNDDKFKKQQELPLEINGNRGKWENLIYIFNEHLKAYYYPEQKNIDTFKPNTKPFKIDTTTFNELYKLVRTSDSIAKNSAEGKNTEYTIEEVKTITSLIEKINDLGAGENPTNTDSTQIINKENQTGANTQDSNTVNQTEIKNPNIPKKKPTSENPTVEDQSLGWRKYTNFILGFIIILIISIIILLIKYKKNSNKHSSNRLHGQFSKSGGRSNTYQQNDTSVDKFDRDKDFLNNAEADYKSLNSISTDIKVTQEEHIVSDSVELEDLKKLLKKYPELYPSLLVYAQELIDKKNHSITPEIEKPRKKQSSNLNSVDYLYFKEPNSEGFFDHSKRLLEQSHLTLFRLELNNFNNVAKFRFDTNDPKTITQALGYTKYKIEPVCDVEGVHPEHATSIISLESGQAKLNDDQQWVVTKKAKVKFIKS